MAGAKVPLQGKMARAPVLGKVISPPFPIYDHVWGWGSGEAGQGTSASEGDLDTSAGKMARVTVLVIVR